MKDLNGLVKAANGFILIEAKGINDLGQITGWGLLSGTSLYSFLLNPIYLDNFEVAIQSSSFLGREYTVDVKVFAGHEYQLQRSPSLDPASQDWQSAGSSFSPAVDQVVALSDANATGSPMFYRVILVPQNFGTGSKSTNRRSRFAY